jgi:triosephosphate isomerase
MNLGSPDAAAELAKALVQPLGDVSSVDSVLCPPYTALDAVSKVLKGSSIGLGAQNIYPEAGGAFTGEISTEFLKDIGCTYCILGHSERRAIIKETDAFINQKVQFVLTSGLTPILCCGETQEERDKGVTEDVVRRHITEGLKGVSADDAKKVILAYEPVWAIGTGLTAKPDDAEAVHAFIRNLLVELYSSDVAEIVRIQYGGSVKPDNAAELMAKPNIDGALVGGASLKADSFAAIVQASA